MGRSSFQIGAVKPYPTTVGRIAEPEPYGRFSRSERDSSPVR
jgi:hypothetical protein